MSGKTIYIKMIAIIQIMAQIGCFVPAKSAKMRMTDRIFSRIGFADSIEAGASSFTVELREMEFIYSNMTSNSLVIIDELCRSTNPQEGELICWKYCEKLLKYIGFSDENYFKPVDAEDELNGIAVRPNRSLHISGSKMKLKDVSRPFIFLTTHFPSLARLPEKYNNAINLHMFVHQKIVDDKLRLEFKYKIQSGPTSIKSYGLALARCLRFPTSLLDRAEELVEHVMDESLVDINLDKNASKVDDEDEPMEKTFVQEEMTELSKDVIDLYSYILLLMSTSKDKPEETGVSTDTINAKLKQLISKMSPEFKHMIQTSSLEDIISVLNASRLTT